MQGNKTPHIVFFDVGNTLLRAEPDVATLFVDVARDRGHAIALDDVAPLMADLDAFYQRAYLTDGDFWCVHDRAVQLWLDLYTLLARGCGLAHDADGIARTLYERYLHAENWALFPDVEPCLRTLKRAGISLGIISNWDASLENLIRELGLLPFFDEVVASAAVGCRKPSRAIFEIALERMGADPQNAVHVGDLPEADGQGAESAGIHPVIVDRSGALGACGFACIGSLVELPGFIAANS